MRFPNFFTAGSCALPCAILPPSTSIIPPLAAFIMNFLSAALRLPPPLPEALPGASAGAVSSVAEALFFVGVGNIRGFCACALQASENAATQIAAVVQCENKSVLLFIGKIWFKRRHSSGIWKSHDAAGLDVRMSGRRCRDGYRKRRPNPA